MNYGTTTRTWNLMAALTAALLLSACGGGGTGSTPVTAADTGSSGGTATSLTSNSNGTASLTLSGAPLTSISAGRSYSFSPTATPATGASFSITSKPAWATFNTSTGALTGTPSSGDVGTVAGIVITANNGTASASLPAFNIAVTAATASTGAATLSWTPPTQNTDGTSVTNLAGYNIYYGTSADQMTNKIQITNAGLTAYTVADLSAGTYFFAISAYAASGVEGAPSTVGSKTIG